MKTFSINLIRGYNILIETENEEKAKRLVEYYIGNPKDDSNESERVDFNFSIGEIELTMNEAIEVKEANG